MTYLVFDGADRAAEEALHQRGRQYEVPPSASHVKLHNRRTRLTSPGTKFSKRKPARNQNPHAAITIKFGKDRS